MNTTEMTQDHISDMIVNEKDNDINLEQHFLKNQREDSDLEEDLLNHVVKSKAIFKSQQKDDPDLTSEEKLTIARNVLKKSNCLFLSKFGQYLKEEHLKYFDKGKNENYELAHHVARLRRYFSDSTRQTDIRNRRYQALKTLIEKGEYFSESEMMKRNPLLYDHLVGQYMTEKQKQIRDNIDTKNITFVNLLIESIERDDLSKKQKLQEEEELNILEQIESDNEEDSSYNVKSNTEETFQWGKMEELNKTDSQNTLKEINRNPQSISETEKQILKQEFVTNMYQNFLDGKDTDFDYSTVDNNEAYDNIDLQSQDEEDKYFDSESPEVVGSTENTNQVESEDELDIYMKSLKEQVTTSIYYSDNLD